MSNTKILDVRTKEEWDAGHVDSAIHIPIDQLLEGKLPDVDKDANLLVHCRSGVRAGMATEYLKAQGFTNVTNVKTLENAQKLSQKA